MVGGILDVGIPSPMKDISHRKDSVTLSDFIFPWKVLIDWLYAVEQIFQHPLFYERWLRADFVQGWLDFRYGVGDLG